MELLLCFLAVPFLFLLSLYLINASKPNTKTGFRTYPIVGAMPDFLKNRSRFLDWTTEVLAISPNTTAVLYRPSRIHGVLTANPDVVEYILKTNFENYPKGEKRFIIFLKDFLGHGIFNSDGDLWKFQRKTAVHEFNTRSLRNFSVENARIEIFTRLIPMIAKAGETGQVLDLQDMLERFAFDSICKLAFNVDPGCLGGDGTAGSEFMHAFEDAAQISSGRFMYPFPILWKFKRFINWGSERSLRNSIKIVHDFADEIIRSRLEQRNEERKDEDLLSRFIVDNENSPEFLRDVVISFILAGRDTTSSALTWFFWLLASNKDVEENILNELETIRKRYGKNIGDTYNYDAIRDMHYLHAAISESMRLYPPVPLDTKSCLKDDILLDGTFIRKDWFVTYHTYAMGRMESVWGKDCRDYRPERWLENEMYRQESSFRFPVFHAGPRICLGKDLAYVQMKAIASSIIERFELDVQDKDKCREPLLSLTLRMKGGLQFKAKERFVGRPN
ncbi:cytochrome P450 94A1-like [Tripterygium wilfordii]|uniref:cytochrome P450 94A1-like n=1 Tax=Tripterygium wilfordii TaxID=458696 RepID=UPI0018F841EC|nr:cytochrome P450 94A1-like [Tripterygium wilfordii]